MDNKLPFPNLGWLPPRRSEEEIRIDKERECEAIADLVAGFDDSFMKQTEEMVFTVDEVWFFMGLLQVMCLGHLRKNKLGLGDEKYDKIISNLAALTQLTHCNSITPEQLRYLHTLGVLSLNVDVLLIEGIKDDPLFITEQRFKDIIGLASSLLWEDYYDEDGNRRAERYSYTGLLQHTIKHCNESLAGEAIRKADQAKGIDIRQEFGEGELNFDL